MKEKPNILWICTDQQRFDTLGCYGNRHVRTPRLNSLAASGFLFENAFCQHPMCTPSRASFLTGRYPRTVGTRQNGQSIPETELLITRLLADAGYDCGLSGKLHISCVNPSVSPGTERRIDDGYTEFHWMHHPYPDWPTNEYQLWLAEQGVPWYDEPFQGSPFTRTGMPEQHHHTTWCAQKAIDFISDRADSSAPWLFSVNTFDPHHIFDPPIEYFDRYLDNLDDLPLPAWAPGELDNKPSCQRDHFKLGYDDRTFETMSERDHRIARAGYLAMCDLIDVQVGRMLDTLERTGQRDSTIVIFTSDHGELLGDHGLYYKGPMVYDPSIHIPLIISMPGTIPENSMTADLVELVDIAPTLADACGLPAQPQMHGRSLWPLLTGEAIDEREDIYCESYDSNIDGSPDIFITMVRTARHKLAAVHGTGEGELYDLEADPGETVNLWNSPDYSELKLDMYRRLCDRMAYTADPLPLRAGEW